MLEIEQASKLDHGDTLSSDPESALDFRAEALHGRCMQLSTKDLVVLVRVEDDATGFRVLYANSFWESTLQVSITPPTRLSEFATASGPGVLWTRQSPPPCGPVLWHWLILDGVEPDEIHRRLTRQKDAGVLFYARLRCSAGYPRPKVCCRIIPARFPLD